MCQQTSAIPDGTEFLFVDLQLEYMGNSRRLELDAAVAGRFPYKHIAPKPSSWQGSHRKTQRDYFAAAGARNTAFIHATTTHIACVDDLSIVVPCWLDQVKHAIDGDYIMCGAYRKVDNMVVDSGLMVSYGKAYHDSRWRIGSDSGVRECGGGLLYGCNFALPLEAAVRVNGFDEMCDAGGGEDYDFGIRLSRAGYPMYYNRNALSIEANDLHNQPPVMVRRKKVCGNGEDSDWWMLNRLNADVGRFTTLAQWTNIEDMKCGVTPTLPHTDWPDGQPLCEM